MEISAQIISGGQAQGRIYELPIVSQETPHYSLNEARQRAHDLLSHSTLDSAIVAVYEMLLDDPAWLTQIQERMSQGIAVQDAIVTSAEEFATQLSDLDDPYLTERAQDVRDIASLWVRQLGEDPHPLIDFPENTILKTPHLTVPDLACWSTHHLSGIITQGGSPTMHAALIAQGLGIPVVSVTPKEWTLLVPGRLVALDGEKGRITDQLPLINVPQETSLTIRQVTDSKGHPIHVMMNIGSLAEAEHSLKYLPDGVGLLRTELLFSAYGKIPEPSDQTSLFETVLSKISGQVTIRTFDIGSDKPLAPLKAHTEANPALGSRGCRVYRQFPDTFRDHLQAILRAARSFPNRVSVMFPMIASLADWDFCHDMFLEEKSHLSPHDTIPVGAMCEVPSLVYLIPELSLKGAQFLSIGTNDFTQYLCATDREQTLSGSLSDLALARAWAHLAEIAQASAVELQVCGNVASEIPWILILLGLGIRHLSVPGTKVQPTKAFIQRLKHSAIDLPAVVANVLRCHDEMSFHRTLDDYLSRV